MLALAKEDRQIVAVTSDSRGSGKLGPFGQALPQQIVEVGIAEQNLVGIAAGLVGGRQKGVRRFAGLLSHGSGAGADQERRVLFRRAGCGRRHQRRRELRRAGSTHHSLHDLAALRAIHNITVVVPADNFETQEAVRAAATASIPVYLRFGKAAMPIASWLGCDV